LESERGRHVCICDRCAVKRSHYPTVRTIAFVSKQDTKNLEYTVEAVRAGKLTIPIGSKVPLRNAAQAHAAVAKGGAGKILLLP
jgi:hypothetical protein